MVRCSSGIPFVDETAAMGNSHQDKKFPTKRNESKDSECPVT